MHYLTLINAIDPQPHKRAVTCIVHGPRYVTRDFMVSLGMIEKGISEAGNGVSIGGRNFNSLNCMLHE